MATIDSNVEVEELKERIKELQDEISLLTLTGGIGDGRAGTTINATLHDLQEQVFQKSEDLVRQGEKNMQMGEKYQKVKAQLQDARSEIKDVRIALLKGIVGHDVDETVYQHIKLEELVRLRLKAAEHEMRVLNATVGSSDASGGTTDAMEGDETDKTAHTANMEGFSAVDSINVVSRLEKELRLARNRNKRMQERIVTMETDLNTMTSNLAEFQALKEKHVEMAGRERVEQESRMKLEISCRESTEKIVALSDHIEKLMVHLKHEAAAKTKAVDLHRRVEKELVECKEKYAALSKKAMQKDQQLQELEQGAKILEDQLRLMDEKFIEVRNKLDWTRATSQKETKKLQSELTSLRMKWQMASDMGLLTSMPDWVATQSKLKKGSKPLGSSHSESQLLSNNNMSGLGGLTPVIQGRNGSQADSLPNRFDIPKLPQPDSENGMPWSDAKLTVLQRQLQDKRKN